MCVYDDKQKYGKDESDDLIQIDRGTAVLPSRGGAVTTDEHHQNITSWPWRVRAMVRAEIDISLLYGLALMLT